ncbi:TPA: hypothetical protein ACSIYJ_004029, partial [Acinetobacter baumannii]
YDRKFRFLLKTAKLKALNCRVRLNF